MRHVVARLRRLEGGIARRVTAVASVGGGHGTVASVGTGMGGLEAETERAV